MCETKTALVSLSLIRRAAASICIQKVNTAKDVGLHNEIESQSPYEN